MLKNYVKLIVVLVFASNVMAQNVPSYVPINGLVGWWPFNGNANDESGNGNNGTVNGASLTADRNGKANSAYSFNGNDNFIKVTHNNSFNFINKYSIALYFRLVDYSPVPAIPNSSGWTDPERTLISKPLNSGWADGSLNIKFTPDDKYIKSGSLGIAVVSTKLVPTLDNWHNLIITYDGTQMKLFYDGNIKDSILVSGNMVTSTQDLFFGKGFNSVDNNLYRWFKGQLDDIAIYNRALTEQEITALYTATPVAQNIPSYVPTNGLVGYWPFNGNANDESGNGNNGTVNGATLTADRNGVANSSYSFDGISNYIKVSNSKTLDIVGSQITMAYWVKSNNESTDPNYKGLSKGGYDVGTGYEFMYRNNFSGDNGVIHLSGGTGVQGCNVPFDMSSISGKWTHLAVTFNNETVNFYLNGVLLNGNNINLIKSFVSNNDDLYIGKRNPANSWAGLIKGQLDDIAIYNRALTQQEITALYTGTPATGLASTKVFIEAPATVNQHQEVELSISTEALNTADNVIAYQTDFSFDTTRFTYVGSNLVGTLNPVGTVGINKSKNGLLQVGYMSQTALNGAGSLVKLKFKANNTTGQGVFGLANFMYNNTTISSLKSDTVTTLDVTPPTAKITYTQNPVRKGDSLLITVNFNEKMAVSPVPQLNLTGQNTLSNTNLTKVNDTTYTFWWVVEKGNGAVNVTLANGKDLGGNAIVATPTQNASFSVLPTLFGDVDTNSFVRAYDAALALQYSVGLNPLPTMDPLPWSNWRIAVANVDTVGNVTANDASLILQKSIGQIAAFPADAKKRGGETPTANVTVAQEGNQLVFRATGSLYACNVYMKDNFNVFGQPEVKDKNAMVASNITTTTYKVGLAATTPLVENEPFLVIPILTNENLQGTLDIVANAQEKSLSYGKAAGLTTINQEAVIVYPNPTKDVVTITNAQGKTLRIVDVQGKEVYNQKVTTSSMEVSMKVLGAKGMYLVHIVDANNESIQKQQIILE